MRLVRGDQAVSWYEMPIVFLVSARFTRDDDVSAMVFNSFTSKSVCRVGAVRIVRIFSVQGRASIRGVIQRWWFLRGMVPESTRNHLDTLRRAEIQAVRLSFCA